MQNDFLTKVNNYMVFQATQSGIPLFTVGTYKLLFHVTLLVQTTF